MRAAIWLETASGSVEEGAPEVSNGNSHYHAARSYRREEVIESLHQNPTAEYETRARARREQVELLTSRENRISKTRLAVFIVGIVVAWIAVAEGAISAWWILIPAVLFIVLVVLHDRAIAARQRFERAAAFNERGLARLQDRWAGSGPAGERFRDPHHPYAGDLDILGNASLFQLLCNAGTAGGEEKLAAWLLAGAETEEILSRQQAVTELRPQIDLREDLAILGHTLDSQFKSSRLAEWAGAPPVIFSRWERFTAPVLATLSSIALLLAFPSVVRALIALSDPELAASIEGNPLMRVGSLPFLVMMILQLAFAFRLSRRVGEVVEGVDRAGGDLSLISKILERMERERFSSPRLADLRKRLDAEGEPPSKRIARLNRLIDLLESRRNQFFYPIAALWLWTTQLAFGIERWRNGSGPSITTWIDAVSEFEALGSIAAFSWEHPDYPFPEIAADGPTVRGIALGHPLIPQDRRIANDLSLDGETRLLLVSGSNMSGKSTMLRTVGTNTVLALAGAPVCATSLTVSPIRIGASIQINDSLQEGSSHFYAEISRLKQVVELARGEASLLFLLDEILHGTNSHDRRIGAEAVIRSLIELGAIGLVTTHDLALARIAEQPELRAQNVHFADHMEDGRMAFDYRMRPGVVEKSNALALMRAVGLDV